MGTSFKTFCRCWSLRQYHLSGMQAPGSLKHQLLLVQPTTPQSMPLGLSAEWLCIPPSSLLRQRVGSCQAQGHLQKLSKLLPMETLAKGTKLHTVHWVSWQTSSPFCWSQPPPGAKVLATSQMRCAWNVWLIAAHFAQLFTVHHCSNGKRRVYCIVAHCPKSLHSCLLFYRCPQDSGQRALVF